jgi:tRNA pseudouridine55 synthase
VNGLLLIDKPIGWTSFDVVNYVRRIVADSEGKKPKQVKVGHAGTLDPFASGLLILLIGKQYTRRAQELSKLDKTYEVTMRLGITSDTGDVEGSLSDVSQAEPSLETLGAAICKFQGEIKQIPPIYSAIKINGQRAYKLARSGQVFEMPPRQVTVYKLELVNYEYPHLKLLARVSSGTYIRSLVEDIGKELGVGAYTTQLKRTLIAEYDVKKAVSPKSLTASKLEESSEIIK